MVYIVNETCQTFAGKSRITIGDMYVKKHASVPVQYAEAQCAHPARLPAVSPTHPAPAGATRAAGHGDSANPMGGCY